MYKRHLKPEVINRPVVLLALDIATTTGFAVWRKNPHQSGEMIDSGEWKLSKDDDLKRAAELGDKVWDMVDAYDITDIVIEDIWWDEKNTKCNHDSVGVLYRLRGAVEYVAGCLGGITLIAYLPDAVRKELCGNNSQLYKLGRYAKQILAKNNLSAGFRFNACSGKCSNECQDKIGCNESDAIGLARCWMRKHRWKCESSS